MTVLKSNEYIISPDEMLRCCTPVKVGDYVEIRRPVFPKGTIVKSVHRDENMRGFRITIWNKSFSVIKEGEWIPRFEGVWGFECCTYRIVDQ